MKKIIFIILLFFSVCTHAETRDGTVSSFYKLIKETQKSSRRMIFIRGVLSGIGTTYILENFRSDKNEEDRNFRKKVALCIGATNPEIIEDIFVKKYLEAEFNDEDSYLLALYDISIEYCIKKVIKQK